MDDLSIRIKEANGRWVTIGTDHQRGVYAENIELSSNEWGSDKATFELRRDSSMSWPDLAGGAPIEIEVGGVLVWSGRILETPTRIESGSVINVQAEGWQYALDDDVFVRLYVHTRMADWTDSRTNVNEDLTLQTTPWEMKNDRGALYLALPRNAVAANNHGVRALMNLGPGLTFKRLVFSYASGAAGVLTLASFSLNSSLGQLSATTHTVSPTATVTWTPTTPGQIAAIRLFNGTGANVTGTDNTYARFTAIRLFGETTWESGGNSILKASDVVRDALAQAAPEVNPAGIENTTFNIPDFTVLEPKTPREVIEAVNAFHNNIAKVDVDKRMIFKARPTLAKYEIGLWPGSTFEDTSLNNLSEAYNRVLVTGTGPDGSVVREERTAAHSLLDRWGRTRTKVLPIEAPLTTVVAQQIGNVFLEGSRLLALKGTATITPGGVRSTTGTAIHPSILLRETGELLRVTHITDPNTGYPGHEGRIARVTYRHAERSASVELDSGRRSFEALLSQYGAVVQAKNIG